MSPEDAHVLPVVRAAELDEPDVARRWLIDPLWARAGVGIIGGAPKCCKSWLGLDLAVSVASGTPCLDTFPVAEPGGALVYMAEDAAPVVKERLAGLCRHRGLALAALPIGVITAPSVRLDLPRDQHRLAETVRRQAPRLLLLDPFVRLHRINENQASDVAAVLGYLRELQRTYDLAVAVVHHARKNGGPTGGGQSLRGSGDFFAWVDTGTASNSCSASNTAPPRRPSRSRSPSSAPSTTCTWPSSPVRGLAPPPPRPPPPTSTPRSSTRWTTPPRPASRGRPCARPSASATSASATPSRAWRPRATLPDTATPGSAAPFPLTSPPPPPRRGTGTGTAAPTAEHTCDRTGRR